MLSSGKNQDLSKGFDIAFSDILLCTISYTQTTYLHTIRVSDNKSRVNSIILVVTAISTKILPIIQIWGCFFSCFGFKPQSSTQRDPQTNFQHGFAVLDNKGKFLQSVLKCFFRLTWTKQVTFITFCTLKCPH